MEATPLLLFDCAVLGPSSTLEITLVSRLGMKGTPSQVAADKASAPLNREGVGWIRWQRPSVGVATMVAAIFWPRESLQHWRRPRMFRFLPLPLMLIQLAS